MAAVWKVAKRFKLTDSSKKLLFILFLLKSSNEIRRYLKQQYKYRLTKKNKPRYKRIWFWKRDTEPTATRGDYGTNRTTIVTSGATITERRTMKCSPERFGRGSSFESERVKDAAGQDVVETCVWVGRCDWKCRNGERLHMKWLSGVMFSVRESLHCWNKMVILSDKTID